ncbi:hypothetical protein BCR33DRAFT_719122 [Rhizoclosmatium globosum]|uniref:BHLH domain-containing protein n=1 Tax=Rhizoclosmatium globosum TaxID=329046 RepID=A0A1Y2C2C5_9FUNG|nr:hypothetical protein BCR33DRAFT_719122 [Rhizoclosmatium globosum]|eukprot:ORY41027.1 hypothetical protein BCR33DRAFT_719122 [Rhizoclosmatium globosum]
MTQEEVNLITSLQFDSAAALRNRIGPDMSPSIGGTSSGLTPVFNHFDPFQPNGGIEQHEGGMEWGHLDTPPSALQPRSVPPPTPVFSRIVAASPLGSQVYTNDVSAPPFLFQSPIPQPQHQTSARSSVHISSPVSESIPSSRRNETRRSSPLSSERGSRSRSVTGSIHSDTSVRLTPAQIMELQPHQFNVLNNNPTVINTSIDVMQFNYSNAPLYVTSENSSRTSSASLSDSNSSPERSSSKGSDPLRPTTVTGGDAVLDLLEGIEGPRRNSAVENTSEQRRREFRREAERRRRELVRQSLHEIRRVLPSSSNLDSVASKERVLEKAAEYIAELQRTESEKANMIDDLEKEIEAMKKELMKK